MTPLAYCQVYHTKLEQLNTLTNRLNAIGKTLGVGYFPYDILEPTLADGEAYDRPEAFRDVTPERFKKLEKELVRGKAEVVSRWRTGSFSLLIRFLYTRTND